MSEAPIPKSGRDYLRVVLSCWWIPLLVSIEHAVDGNWLQVTTLVLIAIAMGMVDYFCFVRNPEKRMLLPTMGMISGATVFIASVVWFFYVRSQLAGAAIPNDPAMSAPTTPTLSSVPTSSSAPVPPAVVERPTVILAPEPGRLVLYNKGEKNFYLFGDKLDNEPGDFSSPPVVVPKDGFYYLLTNHLDPPWRPPIFPRVWPVEPPPPLS